MNAEQIHDLIEAETGRGAMDVLSKSLRAQFRAAPGHRLIVGDFSNIESRVVAWTAGEDWKLQAFRDYDAGLGADLYVLEYAKAFHVDPTSVTKRQRQIIAKPMSLASQYQGSCGALLRFMTDISPLVATVTEQFYGGDNWRKAGEQHDRTAHHMGLSSDQWISLKIVINAWREANPRIVQSWWDRQDGMIEAVDRPGEIVEVCGGKIRYLVAEGFLWCRLPSGKMLAYSSPRLREKKDDWLVDENGDVVSADEMTADEIELRIACGAQLREGRKSLQVVYDGRRKNGSWGPVAMYGGSACNNDVQGLARELLRFAMGNVERAGYPIVLHVHDELVAEVAEAFGSADHFAEIMSILPPWLEELPLAVKAASDQRYVK